MLTEERRGARDSSWRVRKMNRAAERSRRTCLRMNEIDDHAARARLRMRERLANRIDGTDRNARRIEGRDPLGLRPGGEHGVHLRDKLIEMTHAHRVVGEARIVAPL